MVYLSAACSVIFLFMKVPVWLHFWLPECLMWGPECEFDFHYHYFGDGFWLVNQASVPHSPGTTRCSDGAHCSATRVTLHHCRQTMNDKRWAARQRGLRYRCLEPSVCLYVHTQLISWITTMRISKTIWKFYIWKMNKKSWWILMGVRKQAAINSTKLSAIVENCVAVAVNSTQLSTIVDNCCELCCCSH